VPQRRDIVTKYEIEYAPAAAKYLSKLRNSKLKSRLDAAIEKLAENPRPSGCKKLVGRGNLYRVRTGEYRVIYRVDDGVLVVLVLYVGHRSEIYG